MGIISTMSELISFNEYLTILDSSLVREDQSMFNSIPYLCVDWQGAEESALRKLPACPVIAIGTSTEHPLVDICIEDEATMETLRPNLDTQPTACATLVQLLRHNANSSVTEGLFAESLAYSTLQQSQGFMTWLQEPRPVSKPDTAPVLLTERHAQTLTITLNRPHAHNAYSTALKDALCEVLHAALTDETLRDVVLRGNGPSYCAGGDLSEFGQVTDAAEAHLSRTTRSAGALLASLATTTKVYTQGACIGAGIEIPAFADQIIAHENSFFQLPEVTMGLVPGAGGTVSLTKKIGRHKTAYLAISNSKLSAQAALSWGLIDEVVAEPD